MHTCRECGVFPNFPHQSACAAKIEEDDEDGKKERQRMGFPSDVFLFVFQASPSSQDQEGREKKTSLAAATKVRPSAPSCAPRVAHLAGTSRRSTETQIQNIIKHKTVWTLESLDQENY